MLFYRNASTISDMILFILLTCSTISNDIVICMRICRKTIKFCVYIFLFLLSFVFFFFYLFSSVAKNYCVVYYLIRTKRETHADLYKLKCTSAVIASLTVLFHLMGLCFVFNFFGVNYCKCKSIICTWDAILCSSLNAWRWNGAH